ncbi:hypothetical protein HGRIS_006135 [Hohenbuehelia grisea]|uniref:RING-type domain-containing protein n=1 Tax=Hohenbuehelia grisea TaxID=104357 RepID=A0ABR3K130_9AGAR
MDNTSKTRTKQYALDLRQFPSYITPRKDFDDANSIPEYDSEVDVNLGAESPASILHADVAADADDQWAKSGIAVHTNVPTRRWRSNSFNQRKRELQRESVDRDCGICFEIAVVPCRTQCCGKLFCLEHLSEWLHGSSSDGRCPSCKRRCALGINTISLASPSIPSTPPWPIVDQGFATMTDPQPMRELSLAHLLPLKRVSDSSRSASPSSSSSSADLSLSTSASEEEPRPRVMRARSSHGQGQSFLSALTNPEFMGGAAERILSLVGLTLLFYVLLS